MHSPQALRSILAVAVAALVAGSSSLTLAYAQGPSSGDRLTDVVSQRLSTAAADDLIPVIVEAAPDGRTPSLTTQRSRAAEDHVRATGGRVLGSSALLGATAAQLTPAQIRSLAADPAIGRIHYDAPVHSASTSADTTPPGPTPIVFGQSIGAPQAWGRGDTGQGVTVAVIDSGIAADPVAFGSRIKARVDLVSPDQPAAGDPAGHGTHVAGIVAASRSSASPGIAPDANLVSVRVLDAQGGSRVSTVVMGLEWVVAHRAALGIKVAVLALGAPAVTGYQDDPLAAAVELAWHSGLVVVAAAGNDGPGRGTVESPAIDPLIISVGADDDHGSAARGDDSIPTWSSVGPTPDGLAKPDLVAPGRKIVSVRVPGSTTDLQNPTHVESATTIRFSGTSQAAAVTAGSAALLLSARPDLSPDQTKALLVRSATHIEGADRGQQGAGLLNVAAALSARTPNVEQSKLPPAAGVLRALLPVLHDQGFGRLVDEGEGQSVKGDQVRWDQVRWDQVRWDQVRWDQVRWDQVRWDQVRWDQVRWDQVRWDQVRWDQVRWDQVRWDQVRWDATPLD